MKERPNKWRLLTAAEACPLLGYKTAKALRAAAQQGLVPRVMIGKCVRFDPEVIRQWAAKGGTSWNEQQISEAQSQVTLVETSCDHALNR